MKNIKLVFDEKVGREIFGKAIELIEDELEKKQSILELNSYIEDNKSKAISYFYDDEKLVSYEEKKELENFLWRNLSQIEQYEDFFIFYFHKYIQPSFEILYNELDQTESILIPYKMIIEGSGEDLREFALKKINFSDGYLYK